MSYNKRTWATGNVVGAVDLNRIENGIADIDVDEIRGWGVQETQLFSETVTTTDQEGVYVGTLTYSDDIIAPTISVTLNTTTYTCAQYVYDGTYFYGGFTTQGIDFSEYPFFIASNNGHNDLVTESAGTYTVSASIVSIEISDEFSGAVNTVAESFLLPLQCKINITNYDEMATARNAGRLMYVYLSNNCYFITGFDVMEANYTPAGSFNLLFTKDGLLYAEAGNL